MAENIPYLGNSRLRAEILETSTGKRTQRAGTLMGQQSGNALASIQAARTETHQVGVMAGGALIPLLGKITPDSFFSQPKHLFIHLQ